MNGVFTTWRPVTSALNSQISFTSLEGQYRFASFAHDLMLMLMDAPPVLVELIKSIFVSIYEAFTSLLNSPHWVL